MSLNYTCWSIWICRIQKVDVSTLFRKRINSKKNAFKVHLFTKDTDIGVSPIQEADTCISETADPIVNVFNALRDSTSHSLTVLSPDAVKI